MSSWLDYTINGLILGNVYALVAVGLALIFGVSRLINFAQGSIYLVGAYVGWVAVVALRTPLYITIVLVAAIAALVGLIIERFGLRPLQNSVRIAPLLATIGISFVLDQIVMLTFSPNPRALPSQLPDIRFQIGTGTIGPLDILIAGIGITSALLLFALPSSAGPCGPRRRIATPPCRWASTSIGSTRQCSGSPPRLVAFPACWSACTTTRSTRR